MKRIPSSLRQVLLVAGLASLPGLAGAVDLNDLVKHSPFGEAKSATVTEKPSNLEFRGMYVDRGVTYFSIYNTTTKLSAWVAQGEAPAGLVPVSVKSYDAETDSIILENAGQPVKLSLRQAVIGVAPAAPAPMPQAPARPWPRSTWGLTSPAAIPTPAPATPSSPSPGCCSTRAATAASCPPSSAP